MVVDLLLFIIIILLTGISWLLFTIQQILCRYVSSFIYGKQEIKQYLLAISKVLKNKGN